MDVILDEEIGSGSYSKVFKATDPKIDHPIAVKVVASELISQLLIEKKVLQKLSNSMYFPKYYWIKKAENKAMLGLELLGLSLTKYALSETLPSYKLYKLISQSLSAIRKLHKSGFIHNDIKPSNFCINKDIKNSKKHNIKLIDFGLASKYLNSVKNHNSRSFIKFTGNLAFCSENVACGISSSRRDDLESLFYVAIFLEKKNLPWLKAGNDHLRVVELRMKNKESLTKNMPKEIDQALQYCKQLKFDEKPNYSFLKGLLKSCIKKMKNEMFFAEIISMKQKKEHKKTKTQSEILEQNLICEFPTLITDFPKIKPETRMISKFIDNNKLMI